jgi:hypothetical protein
MKNLFLLLIISFIVIAVIKLGGVTKAAGSPSAPIHIKTGEDDDQPVFIQTTRKLNNEPAVGVSITLVDIGIDTFSTQTGPNGVASIKVNHPGQYLLRIESPLYVDVYDTVTILPPQTLRLDTLLEE